MVLSDATNKKGLIEDIDFWVKTDSSSYSLADKKRNINRAYKKVQSFILENTGDWIFEGNIASIASVVDQNEYTFPSDVLTIERVEIRYNSGDDDWVVANPIDRRIYKEAIANKTDNYGESNPVYWLPDNTTIAFDPTPDAVISPAIKIYYTDGLTELSADTDEPVFAEPFHRILSLEAALDYASSNDMIERRNLIKSNLDELYPQLGKFYTKRHKDKKIRIIPRIQTYE